MLSYSKNSLWFIGGQDWTCNLQMISLTKRLRIVKNCQKLSEIISTTSFLPSVSFLFDVIFFFIYLFLSFSFILVSLTSFSSFNYICDVIYLFNDVIIFIIYFSFLCLVFLVCCISLFLHSSSLSLFYRHFVISVTLLYPSSDVVWSSPDHYPFSFCYLRFHSLFFLQQSFFFSVTYLSLIYDVILSIHWHFIPFTFRIFLTSFLLPSV